MNKRITRKIFAAFAVATLFVGGAIAQTPIPGYDDGAGGSNYVSTATEATTQVTVGKTIPLYAEPDAYYHPTYDPITGTGITAGFSWTWTSASAPANITIGAGSDNYTTITGVTAGGPYTVNVVENGPLCSDGTGQDIDITVLDEPTGSLSTTTNLDLCVGDAGLPGAAIQATIDANGASDYHLVWRLEIYTESAGVADEWFDATLGTLGAAQAFAADYTTAAPDQAQTAAGTFNLTAVVPNATINSKTTVYEYTYTSLNDLVSRRGDFSAVADVNAFTWDEFVYYAVGETVSITVHPTPVTGPIFHISNSWAQ